jgi:hypothetical protein
LTDDHGLFAARARCSSDLNRLARVSAAAVLAGALAGLAGCDEAGAPVDRGVCWRASGENRFEAVARNVWSLDDCAAQLEAYHLQGWGRVVGAFQGYYIFVDDRQIASAPGPHGFRYPIFQPGQRRQIDADLRALIKAKGGKAPGAADISVERK